MSFFLANLILALAWGALIGSTAVSTLLVGFAIGAGVLWVARPLLPPLADHYLRTLPRGVALAVRITWELVRSSLLLAWDVITPADHSQPRIIAYPLACESDAEITALANLVSLTPGTFALDVSEDRRVLFIHAMYSPDEQLTIAEIQTKIEGPLLALLRPPTLSLGTGVGAADEEGIP